jgi:hypothetical protein
VTVDEGESLDGLHAAVGQWAGSGITSALVPADWEGVPGSLEGAVPRYPKSMAGVAQAFRATGFTPGITVDPLAVQGGNADWTCASADGQRWLNPAAPDGMAYGIEQMKKVAGWGFAFFAVAPSGVPDDILKHFNMSRARANALAYEIMATAAPDAPVVPASRATLDASRDGWLAAADATCRLREYNGLIGAVRLDAKLVDSVSAETLAAMAFYGGPIEVIGSPSRTLQNQLGRILPRPHWFARAIDAASPAPKLWGIELYNGAGAKNSIAIVSFEGAPAVPADAAASAEAPAWSATAAEFLKRHRDPGVAK